MRCSGAVRDLAIRDCVIDRWEGAVAGTANPSALADIAGHWATLAGPRYPVVYFP